MSFKKQRHLNVLLFLALIVLFTPCLTLNAAEFVSKDITINTDKERNIVIESIDDWTSNIITVNKQGVYSFKYAEPGEYHYRVYESEGDADADERIYIVTVCVMVNETTGELEPPVISVDDEAGKGKPGKIEFGEEKEKPIVEIYTPPEEKPDTPSKEDESSTEKEKTSTDRNTPSDKNGSSPGNNKDTNAAKTGDGAPIILALTALTGMAACARRGKEDEKDTE